MVNDTKSLIARLNKIAAKYGRKKTRIQIMGCQARYLKNLGFTVSDNALNASPSSLVWAYVSWENPNTDTEARKTLEKANTYHERKEKQKRISCKRRERVSQKKAERNAIMAEDNCYEQETEEDLKEETESFEQKPEFAQLSEEDKTWLLWHGEGDTLA